MTLNLNDLHIFVAVAEQGSFTLAAQSLGLPKTTVSRRIASLEHELGLSLFYRNTRQVRLSSEGEKYLEACSSAIRSLNIAHHQLQSEKNKARGRLRLVTSFVIGNDLLSGVLSGFHQSYPEIQLEVQLENRYIDLLKEDVDLALRVGPLSDSRFRARKIATFRYILCASQTYLKEMGRPTFPEDLSYHRCLLTSSSRQPVNWYFENAAGKQQRVLLESRFRCNHLSLCLQLARDNQGIALLPEFMAAPFLQSGEMQSILEDWTCQPRILYAVYPDQHQVPLSVRLFLDYLQSHLPDMPLLSDKS